MKKLVFGILITLFVFSFSYSQEKLNDLNKGSKKSKRCIVIEKEKCKECKCLSDKKSKMMHRQGPPIRISIPSTGQRPNFRGQHFMKDTVTK